MGDDKENPNGWPQYSKLVLSKIDDLSDGHKILHKDLIDIKLNTSEELSKIRSEIAMLKTKAAVWGGLAGTVLGGIISQFFKHVGK